MTISDVITCHQVKSTQRKKQVVASSTLSARRRTISARIPNPATLGATAAAAAEPRAAAPPSPCRWTRTSRTSRSRGSRGPSTAGSAAASRAGSTSARRSSRRGGRGSTRFGSASLESSLGGEETNRESDDVLPSPRIRFAVVSLDDAFFLERVPNGCKTGAADPARAAHASAARTNRLAVVSNNEDRSSGIMRIDRLE